MSEASADAIREHSAVGLSLGLPLPSAAQALFVVPGALLGRWAVDRINQRLFEQLAIAATVVGAVRLLVR